jgi:hypothetical protein
MELVVDCVVCVLESRSSVCVLMFGFVNFGWFMDSVFVGFDEMMAGIRIRFGDDDGL